MSAKSLTLGKWIAISFFTGLWMCSPGPGLAVVEPTSVPATGTLKIDAVEADTVTGVAPDPVSESENFCPMADQVGQMIMVAAPEGALSLTSDYASFIEKHKIGGVLILKMTLDRTADANSLKSYIAQLQDAAPQPLFVAIDQEGGKIQSLGPKHGIPVLPSHAEVGKSYSPDQTYQLGKQIAKQLLEIGFNWNFAPVLDVNSNPKNPVIAGLGRSFSSDPEQVEKFAGSFARGLRSEGMLATAKHFPGHGATVSDSHHKAVMIPKTRDQLNSEELLPYQDMTPYGSVMVGHIEVPKVCQDGPASLSSCFINGILRTELDYEGLVITDSIGMKAVSSQYAIGDAAVQAILAGNDLVLSEWHNATAVVEGVCQALKENSTRSEALTKRVKESNERIRVAKQNMGLLQKPVSLESAPVTTRAYLPFPSAH